MGLRAARQKHAKKDRSSAATSVDRTSDRLEYVLAAKVSVCQRKEKKRNEDGGWFGLTNSVVEYPQQSTIKVYYQVS
jgi:hypothetical protein